jgi:hypothetical protein
MNALAQDPLVFENEEWLVTASGLEHKGTGYFIERATAGDRRGDGMWSWPLHMAEKQWCTLAPFTEAFTCAAALYGLGADVDLARSFKAARCEVAAWPKAASSQRVRQATGLPEALQEGAGIPILWEAPRDGFSGRGEGPGDPGGAPHRIGHAPWERPSGRGRTRTTFRTVTALPWRAPRPIRRAGTRLVQLLQAAWSRS